MDALASVILLLLVGILATVLMRPRGLSPIVGYLVAGLVIGPHAPRPPTRGRQDASARRAPGCSPSSRDRRAVLEFLKRALQRYGRPGTIVTNPYGGSMAAIGIAARQQYGRWLNNRAEHLHSRSDEGRVQWRKSEPSEALKFAAVHASIHNNFNLDHHPTRLCRSRHGARGSFCAFQVIALRGKSTWGCASEAASPRRMPVPRAPGDLRHGAAVNLVGRQSV